MKLLPRQAIAVYVFMIAAGSDKDGSLNLAIMQLESFEICIFSATCFGKSSFRGSDQLRLLGVAAVAGAPLGKTRLDRVWRAADIDQRCGYKRGSRQDSIMRALAHA